MSPTSTPTRLRRVAAGTLSAAALVAVPAAATPHDGHGPRPQTYVLDGQRVFPEGVATGGPYVYATSVADGTIYRGLRREGTLHPWIATGTDGRTAATGIKATRSRVVVAGAATGRVDIYSAYDGSLVATYTVADPGSPTFINDVAFAPNGDVYVTDSQRPVLYRIPAAEVTATPAGAARTLQPAIDLPPETFTEGFNANGIAATPDGEALLVVYSNSGALYRVDIRTGATQAVTLDKPLVNGDGVLLRGRSLFVARNFDNLIVTVRLSWGATRGVTVAERTYPGADIPTTLAFDRGSILAVNSQFDTLFGGAPLTSETFTISRVAIGDRG